LQREKDEKTTTSLGVRQQRRVSFLDVKAVLVVVEKEQFEFGTVLTEEENGGEEED